MPRSQGPEPVSEPAPSGGDSGIISSAMRMGDKIVSTLPPAFLLLVIINAAFLGMVLWFINHGQDARTAMVDKLLDRCMSIALQAQPLGK